MKQMFEMKNFSQIKLINLLLLIGMIILTLFGILAYKEVQHLVKANEWVLHTHKVIDASNVTLLALTEAESRLNYYILTNNKSAIQDLPNFINIARKNIQTVKQLTQDNPIQNIRSRNLESLANAKIALMQQIAMDVPNKQQLAVSPQREQMKKQFIQSITELTQEEFNLLEQRNNLAIHEAALSKRMLIIFGGLTEFFIILSFILLNYYTHQRNVAERKQAEAEDHLMQINKRLKESDERYLLTTEGSSAGLWDWEVGTDNFYYSPYFKKMLGYTDEEFPNSLQSFEKVIHPLDHNHVWEAVNQHLENHIPYKTEFRLQTKSGDYIWFQAAGLALWNEAGVATRMSGSIIDISDRKRVEQRLRIQHAVTEILAEGMTLEKISIKIIKEICENLGWDFGAVWMIDPYTNSLLCTGIWHQPSPLLKKFEQETLSTQLSYGIGLPGRIWEKKNAVWFQEIGDDKKFSRAKAAKKMGFHSALGFPILLQKEILGVIECFTSEKKPPDQQIFDLMSNVGLQIGQFIKRKKIESDLKESESYKTAVLEAASDSIFTINERKEIIAFNPQTIKEFQYTENELQNKHIQLILPNFNLDVTKLFGKPVLEIEGARKNGEKFPVEIKISKMYIENEKMFVIIVRDITERKKVEKIKNEFVSVVSHELRTPITSIRGALGLVLGGTVGALPEKAEYLLKLANNNCERLVLLINDILDIEKLEAGKLEFQFQIVDLNKIVQEALLANKMFAEKYDIKLILTQSNPNKELKVNVDPARLMQVLTNLISNAVKFSPKDEEVIVDIKQQHKNVRVLISNKGPGITKEFQPHIFQKFSQADASNTRGKGGTGLGLNISKSIIEKLGGKINFISKPDEITIFYFDLPLWAEAEKIIKKEKLLAHSDHDKILICEDDVDQANYINKLLDSAGFKTDIAHSVADAKKLLENNNYHALLLDLILPDQDGITFIRELRNKEITRTLPIIVLSVMAQAGRSLLNGEAFSVVDWLDKPIHFEKLLHAIEQVKKRTYPKLPNILHVEDDADTFKRVQTLLENHANVISATTIQDTIETLKESKFDLVILDLLLPDGNAEQLLPLMSEYKLPVIIYSATELDKNLSKAVKHALVKSKTTNEQLLNLINHVLETST